MLNHGDAACCLERSPLPGAEWGASRTGRTGRRGRRFEMGKRARKSKARKKKKANHGKRPTGR